MENCLPSRCSETKAAVISGRAASGPPSLRTPSPVRHLRTPIILTGVFGRRVREGDIDIKTPLWPFRKVSGSYFISQDMASSIWEFGYAYPEVPSRRVPRPSGVGATHLRDRPDQRAVRSRLRQLASQARRRHHASRVDLPLRLHARRRWRAPPNSRSTSSYLNGTDGVAAHARAALRKVHCTAIDKKMRSPWPSRSRTLRARGVDVNDPKPVVGYLRSNID